MSPLKFCEHKQRFSKTNLNHAGVVGLGEAQVSANRNKFLSHCLACMLVTSKFCLELTNAPRHFLATHESKHKHQVKALGPESKLISGSAKNLMRPQVLSPKCSSPYPTHQRDPSGLAPTERATHSAKSAQDGYTSKRETGARQKGDVGNLGESIGEVGCFNSEKPRRLNLNQGSCAFFTEVAGLK